MGLIRFVLIALCIYLIFKWVVGPLLRIILQNYLKGMMEKHGRTQPQQRSQPKKSDGSIHIDYVPKNSPKVDKNNDSQGEYIDYEEIK
jgi:hypothetical protein